MTKKDYKKIAQAIYDSNLNIRERTKVINYLAEVLHEDNPKFNYNKFRQACEMGLK